MIEKGLPCRRKFDAAGLAGQKLDADLVLQVPYLTTERRLDRVEPLPRTSTAALSWAYFEAAAPTTPAGFALRQLFLPRISWTGG